MSTIDLQALIPNNVNLGENRQLQRALEHWQPAFMSWWDEMGPSDFNAKEVYLRTAVGVDASGWASYGYTPMPDYRWGIFLADQEENRKIGFGDHMGQDVWQEVPGEYRSAFRRLIVTQGDTEPASVEQQRLLGHTAPSLYDLRNLFQVNVEEGRHLWAMVYLLHAHFGRDGREEAEELLTRHSGDADKPRILGTFNEPMDNWLSFFMFTYFTDRDGKFQLKSFAESAFDPLARTTRFMLTEEAHHMFVGETGIGRVIKRTLEVMKELDTDNVDTLRKAGVIDLPTVQKFMNFWFTSSLDLFGSEASSNAANYFSNGIKGRPDEAKFADHVELESEMTIQVPDGKGGLKSETISTRNGMNEITRLEYVKDCNVGVTRWNMAIKRAGVDFELSLPNTRFRRSVGAWASVQTDPQGQPISEAEFQAKKDLWLPTDEDKTFIHSLMQRVTEPGKMAGWIAPPDRGINANAIEYEYVKL
ncbi:MAG: benzoyl-CoA 2,3-epoxidase subunit BoxB [Polaromonas sp.]|uniref:benzoyl-CoA 2,3-epoxidase subunit BoxB n=1 Tax=Polaromonas sp. TaxID=1869339 RepID=UPI002734E0A1|nr:benzoyl-CoA 2,3-epoxidase subunit BoxB [Polaromonas sp.]MDP2817031.1 benzoyl-CoA 2,3-epoxidase subunit BoxB [Polaromonas sp.]